MKNILSLIPLLFVLLISDIYSQQNSFTDILPLSIGNRWTYDYSYSSYSLQPHTSTNRNGTLVYQIIGADFTKDSTIWYFHQSGKISYWSSPGYGGYDMDIDNNFRLVESNTGNHKLYTPLLDEDLIFPFQKSETDSTKFFRYQFTDSTGRRTTLFKGLDYYHNSFTYKLDKDSGIVNLLVSRIEGFGGVWRKHVLKEFIHPFSGPHLAITKQKISSSILFGKSKDSLIVLKNAGNQDIIINNVSSSSNKVAILYFSKSISSLKEGSIMIRMYSETEDSIAAKISIDCNSLNTDNNIYVNVRFIKAAVIFFSPQGIFFNPTINGHSSNSVLFVTNNGNIPLKIDSVKASPPFFSKSNSLLIYPNETNSDTIYFLPHISSYHIGKLIFYSNSSSSPNEIMLQGQSVEDANVSLSTQEVNFGIVEIGNSVTSEIQIDNFGTENIMCGMWLKHNSVWYSDGRKNIFSLKDNGDVNISPGVPYRNEITFTPQSSEYVTDTLIVTFFKPEFGTFFKQNIPIHANMNDYLSQNYPNPFNETTKINFRIASPTTVTLKVFNILGQEISTLISDKYNPGEYQYTINGHGLASGVYFYQLYTNKFKQARKFILLK